MARCARHTLAALALAACTPRFFFLAPPRPFAKIGRGVSSAAKNTKYMILLVSILSSDFRQSFVYSHLAASQLGQLASCSPRVLGGRVVRRILATLALFMGGGVPPPSSRALGLRCVHALAT